MDTGIWKNTDRQGEGKRESITKEPQNIRAATGQTTKTT